MRIARIAAVILALGLLAHPLAAQQGGWTPLFNGKDLSGWYPCNGKAPYAVDKGDIVGTTVLDSPNSFLCTKEKYGDFILEYDAWVDTNFNSGVQIRSIADPAIKNGRVHGLQVEIDPSERAWTGGIYDEARRGWLATNEGRESAKQAFKMKAWNAFRVEAIENNVRTWVNGVPVANVLDDLTPSGVIALQVHSIGTDASKAGNVIRFRNIRIMTANLASSRTPDRNDTPQHNYVPNVLSDREAKEGWALLWDGKTTRGWRGAKLTGFPEKGWEIKDGTLSVMEAGGGEATAFGDIVTVGQYENFELIVEYNITTGANSGIKYFVDTTLNKGAGSSIGCEFQILDDAVHPDAKLGVKSNRTNAGLYDLIAPQNTRFNGVGLWNRARIVVHGRRVEHWLNGFKTVEYERGTQMWRGLVNYSKYVTWPKFGEAPKGHILLQDHGNRVSFRTVKIREIR